MGKNDTETQPDPELAAISAVVNAVRELDSSTRQRVIDYVIGRFNLRRMSSDPEEPLPNSEVASGDRHSSSANPPVLIADKDDDGLEGISPVARRWMSRNGINSNDLGLLFSLGIDEIDLVSKAVPGKSKRQKMRSVMLLKGIAAYLGTGAARISHEQFKEACEHYDATDLANFASNLKRMASEVGGTKESGYTLTARGLSAATDLVKSLLVASAK